MKSIDEKIAALLRRSLKRPSDEEVDEACERNLQTFLNAAANMKDQPADEPEPVEELRPGEYVVLNAIYLLRDEVNYKAVTSKASELADKEIPWYEVTTTLHQLVSRGLISGRTEPPSPDDIIRQTTFYKITEKGIRTLVHARESQAFAAQDYRHGWI